MNDEETFEFENRKYINPDISRDEQTDFINTLRDIQAQNNAQIATETHNLGTDIDHPRGGLNGSEEYWKGRYQTPQTEAAIANMKAVAQQSALNTALSNYNNMLQNRYSQAYRDYNKRLYEHNRKREKLADSYYTNSGNNGNGSTQITGGIEYSDPLTTNDSGETEVTVNEAGVTVPSSTQSGFAPGTPLGNLAKNNAQISGGGIPYGQGGSGYYIEDANGNRTGVRVYYNQDGALIGMETPTTSFTASGAKNYLNKIFSNGGKLYTSADRELSTALGWMHAMGVH